MIIEDIELVDQRQIADRFKTFFTEIGPKLAFLIPNTSNDFTRFISVYETLLEETVLQEIELGGAFNSLKSNETSGFDYILSSSSEETFFPLKHNFSFFGKEHIP